MVKVIVGPFDTLSQNGLYIEKPQAVERNSGVLVQHIGGTFDLFVFKVIWGHSVHVSQNDL